MYSVIKDASVCSYYAHILFHCTHFALTFSEVTDKDVLKFGKNKQKSVKAGGKFVQLKNMLLNSNK